MTNHTSSSNSSNQDEAIAYLITFRGKSSYDIGHTSFFAEGPNHENIHVSYFPSTHYRQHWLHAFSNKTIPVKGFNTQSPLKDVHYENGPPVSILKIAGLKFSGLKKEYENYLENKNRYFSMKPNSILNPIHYFLKAINLHRDVHQAEVGGFDPLIKNFPTTDDLITFKAKPSKQPTLFNDCTSAVYRLMVAGQFKEKPKQTTTRLLNIFPRIFNESTPTKPAAFQQLVASAGGIEMINRPEQLPEELQKAMAEGQKIAKANEATPSLQSTLEHFRNKVVFL